MKSDFFGKYQKGILTSADAKVTNRRKNNRWDQDDCQFVDSLLSFFFFFSLLVCAAEVN